MPDLPDIITRLKEAEARATAAEAEVERLKKDMKALRDSVVGWREYDWPSGFDRFTAQLIADHVRYRIKCRTALSEGRGEEYRPQIIRNDAGGVAELILRDVACVYGEERVCRVIRDMNTGDEIGFQWDIPIAPSPEDRTDG